MQDSSSETIVCRICEKAIASSRFESHTNLCAKKKAAGPLPSASQQIKPKNKQKGLLSLKKILNRVRGGKDEPDENELSIEDFELLSQIGKGGFASVFVARKKATGDMYALKAMKKSDMDRLNMIEHILVERDIMASMSSHHIVDLVYAFDSQEYLYLVMEFMIGGDLASMLKNVGLLEERIARRYVAEVVAALEYLHSIGIIHRDLKPDNLLINEEGHMKLTDFGLSGISTEKKPSEQPHLLNPKLRKLMGTGNAMERWEEKQIVGTPDYLAPEILDGRAPIGPGIDLWALGSITFELLTGIPPFCDETVDNVFENVLSLEIPWPEIPSEMSQNAHDFISRLLQPNPDDRLGMGPDGFLEIKGHPWMEGINWDNLHEQSMEECFIPRPTNDFSTDYFEFPATKTKDDIPSFLKREKQNRRKLHHKKKAAPNPLEGHRFKFVNAQSLSQKNLRHLPPSSTTREEEDEEWDPEEGLDFVDTPPVSSPHNPTSLPPGIDRARSEKALKILGMDLTQDKALQKLGISQSIFLEMKEKEEKKGKGRRGSRITAAIRSSKTEHHSKEPTTTKEKPPSSREELKSILREKKVHPDMIQDALIHLLDKLPASFPHVLDFLYPFPNDVLMKCSVCYQRFSSQDNTDDSCIYHPGEINKNVYSCCGRSWLSGRGCVVGAHTGPDKKKRPTHKRTKSETFGGSPRTEDPKREVKQIPLQNQEKNQVNWVRAHSKKKGRPSIRLREKRTRHHVQATFDDSQTRETPLDPCPVGDDTPKEQGSISPQSLPPLHGKFPGSSDHDLRKANSLPSLVFDLKEDVPIRTSATSPTLYQDNDTKPPHLLSPIPDDSRSVSAPHPSNSPSMTLSQKPPTAPDNLPKRAPSKPTALRDSITTIAPAIQQRIDKLHMLCTN